MCSEGVKGGCCVCGVSPQRGWNGSSSQPESMDRATAGRTTYSVQGKLRIGSASGEDNPAQIRNERSL